MSAGALALPAAAVLSVTVLGAGGLIAVGGALGAATDGARDLVQTGVQQAEDLIRSLWKNILPYPVGPLVTLYEGSRDLGQALSNARCTPACSGKSCGPDGCGGLCGSCATPTLCSAGSCVSPDPCGVAGTWQLSCTGDDTCGSCAAADYPSHSWVTISAENATTGASWTEGGRTYTFQPSTCTLSYVYTGCQCCPLTGTYVLDASVVTGSQGFGCYWIETNACMCHSTRSCTASR